MDATLHEDEPELGIEVFAVLFEMLAHVDGSLDQAVEILWDFRGEAVVLEKAKHLSAGNVLDLPDATVVTEVVTDGRWGKSLAGETADLADNLGAGGLEPFRCVAIVGDGAIADPLSVTMHAAHCDSIRKKSAKRKKLQCLQSLHPNEVTQHKKHIFRRISHCESLKTKKSNKYTRVIPGDGYK